MKIIDRLRIEDAVLRYDFWLDVRDVPTRRRRELRRELRANLSEASADVGVTRALFGIGSPKQLAYAATETDPTRLRWSRAAFVAAGVFAVIIIAVIYTATVFTAGVQASGTAGETVRGSVFPWFGVEFSARVDPDRGGRATGAANIQYYLLGGPLLAFVLVAQPSRLLRRRSGRTDPA